MEKSNVKVTSNSKVNTERKNRGVQIRKIYTKEEYREKFKEEVIDFIIRNTDALYSYYPSISKDMIQILTNYFLYVCRLDIELAASNLAYDRLEYIDDDQAFMQRKILHYQKITDIIRRPRLDSKSLDEIESMLEKLSSYRKNIEDLKEMLISHPESKEKYENIDICKKCKDCCCKSASCEIRFEDIKEEYRTKEGIEKLVNTGLICIDKWDADEEDDYFDTYFLRFKNIQDGDMTLSFSYGGTCLLLTEHGCMIPFEKRPDSSRLIIPKEDGRCLADFVCSSKELAKNSWKDHQDLLAELIVKLNEEEARD